MYFKRTLSAFFAVLMLSSILCTFASARSSAYLNSYAATITPTSNGKIVITADVSGVGRMSKIGISTIYLYESTDRSSFYRVATYESDDYPEMMEYNTTNYFRDVVTYQGTTGRYYYASVYVYAANANGSDEKHYNTSIKQAI